MVDYLPWTQDDILKLIGSDKKNRNLNDKVWTLIQNIRELNELRDKAQWTIIQCSANIQKIPLAKQTSISGYLDMIVNKLNLIRPAQLALKKYQQSKSEIERFFKDSSKRNIIEALEKANVALAQERKNELLSIDPNYQSEKQLSNLSQDEFNQLIADVKQAKIEREKIEKNSFFIQNLQDNNLIQESEKEAMFQYTLDKTDKERENIFKHLEIRKNRRDRIQQAWLEAYVPENLIWAKINDEQFEEMIQQAQKEKYKKEAIHDPLRDLLIQGGIKLLQEDHALILSTETPEDAIRIWTIIKVKHAQAYAINQLTHEGFKDIHILNDETDAKLILDTFYRWYIVDQIKPIEIPSEKFDKILENRSQADAFILEFLMALVTSEAPKIRIEEGSTRESLIKIILQQRIMTENERLIRHIDDVMRTKGMMDGNQTSVGLGLRKHFVQRAHSGEKLTEDDARYVLEEIDKEYRDRERRIEEKNNNRWIALRK